MAVDVEDELRSPQGYEMGHSALRGLEKVEVWPTVLNFELWLHVLADPEGTLALEVNALLAAGEPITDTIAEDLARAYLPKARLEAQVGEASDALSDHLGAVASAIDEAQGTTGEYGAQLERARRRLSDGVDPKSLGRLLTDLSGATDRAYAKTKRLEERLAESSVEVKKLREALAQARQDAATDGLSNLANRRSFDEELKRACAEADAKGAPLSLALLDIDHFKTINDTWGHQTGDQVIRFVASVISRVGAPPRFAARFGGDEFAMIFAGEPAGTVGSELEDMVAEVRARQLLRRATNEPLGQITLSAGFAERSSGEAPHALMERADQALYTAKRGGRNRVSGAGEPSPAATAKSAPELAPAASLASAVNGARARVLRALRAG